MRFKFPGVSPRIACRRHHPLLQGVPDAPTNPGRGGHAVMTVTPNLLLVSCQTSDNTWNPTTGWRRSPSIRTSLAAGQY